MSAYYNEFDPYAAQWLRNLISKNLIAPGDVDERSIVDVQPDDLKGYTQVHFFAGIGGWSYAARLAGYPDDRQLWTGSCPCQPFSVAGSGKGEEDERHLWPVFFSLIAAHRPAVVMGEQVAAAVGKDWLDGVYADLESIGYSCGAAVIPACAVDAPHKRDRLWFVADAHAKPVRGGRPSEDVGAQGAREGQGSEWERVRADARNDMHALDDAIRSRLERQCGDGHDGGEPRRVEEVETGPVAKASCSLSHTESLCGRPGFREGHPLGNRYVTSDNRRNSTAWVGSEWAVGADGKARRIEPSIRLLAHGVPARVGKLRAYGNAIVPQVAAEVIGAYMEIAA